MMMVSSFYDHWKPRYSPKRQNPEFVYGTAPLDVSTNISASSGRRKMKLPPFDAAWRGGSNELRYIFLRSLDTEIFNETVSGAVI